MFFLVFLDWGWFNDVPRTARGRCVFNTRCARGEEESLCFASGAFSPVLDRPLVATLYLQHDFAPPLVVREFGKHDDLR
jgi:hypothetical protein